MRASFSSVFAIALAVLLSGCKSIAPGQPAAAAEPKPALRALGEGVKAGDAASEEVSDHEIGIEIRRRLSDNPGETAGVVVEVEDARVTLRGMVPTLAASWRAEAAARSVKGVKQVTNQILAAGTAR